MCTLAWGSVRGKRWACFNRDEQRKRQLAEPPEFYNLDGQRLAFARDPEGEGTWFAVSGYGFCVALLNYYGAIYQPSSDHVRSRGLLVLDIAQAGSFTDAVQLVHSHDLNPYKPFHVCLISLDATYLRTWDGGELDKVDGPEGFLTTSSYRPEEVISWRQSWWEAIQPETPLDSASAGEILRSGNAVQPEFGCTMDRDDARTVSQIELSFDESGYTFSYRDREEEALGYLPPEILRGEIQNRDYDQR